MKTKVCSKCKEEKTLEHFRKRKDGYFYAYCHSCSNKYQREYKRGREKPRVEYFRLYRKSEKYKKIRKEYEKSFRRIEKKRIRNLARQAVESGKLTKQPCEICGGIAEIHHPDYSKPLNVRWFCNKHHRELHLKFKKAKL